MNGGNPIAAKPSPSAGGLLRIAQIQTAHGIRGLVKLRCYLENPEDLETYNPLRDANGKTYNITLKNPIKGDWLAEVDGIADRTAAEKLRGTELFITRDELPETDDGEIYHNDLIGVTVTDENGTTVGTVRGIDNFGAGDLLDIQPTSGGASFYIPFAEPFVTKADETGITVAGIEDFK